MDPLLEEFIRRREHSLIVATVSSKRSIETTEKDGVKYYVLPGGNPGQYKLKRKNIQIWSSFLNEERPDLVHIWGSEFQHGLAALNALQGTPSVIHVQGILSSIARHYCAGIDERELRGIHTLRDMVKRDSILQQRRRYERRADGERAMYRKAGHYICESKWCEAVIKAMAPNAAAHYCPLSINRTFSEHTWSINRVERHSIICNASGYPLKGLHVLLRAVALLKDRYRDVKLYVPGEPQRAVNSMKCILRCHGYMKYISNLVRDLKLDEQVVWLGNLSQEELAKAIAERHVFVLSSSVENHSSSLKEAMMVGAPCVASAVGGIPEYVSHEENGLLYRFGEYELLAFYISEVFDDDSLAVRFGENARSSMRRVHNDTQVYETIIQIYTELLRNRVR